ncbi:alginate O-acetyltransferase AlgX-related protein [Streptococcus acidominimus]|uniref:AlgX/AlgJ SGNH hydrolase-like domain-containing protein n=1 Tax=Streptococcus acidominimus TaxID=1326 RepID=A0A1Q8EDC4_STRAI|nr:hypothetical protein [Streptococcus acidominimus]OLF49814.1 hypothetical protein BU200_05180 [Streptococcus acidominimus]SUN08170.1 Uncharacterised protein [Streptococcus acidominimus]
MKIIKILTIIVFSLIILIPVVTFRSAPHISSEIDNRMLAENSFSQELLKDSEADLTHNIEEYVNDRIGFRDEMILAYTILNDGLFGKMVHPSYRYGKEGYVFGAGLTTPAYQYDDYHEQFANMVKSIQEYCEERNIPFLFVLNPAKPAVLPEYIPAGIDYNRDWVENFLAALDQRKVCYVDNTITLRKETERGNVVFNQKYDANHWNDLGAFYGTNAILSEVKQDFPSVQMNQLKDFEVSSQLESSLPVSQFPIHESVPIIRLPIQDIVTSKTELFKDELQLDPAYQAFAYYQNLSHSNKEFPRVLMFQGSYMNKFGYKYLANAFGEYIAVHDYQNILNFPYYYNIFRPDMVILEVAEYTFSNDYFQYDKMKQLAMNPPLSSISYTDASTTRLPLPTNDIRIEKGKALAKIDWQTNPTYQHVWFMLDEQVYDMERVDNGYTVTLLSENISENPKIELIAQDDQYIVWYSNGH